MITWKGIIMQVCGRHWAAQCFCKFPHCFDPTISLHNSASADNDWVLSRPCKFGCALERRLTTSCALWNERARNDDFVFPVEKITRNVELHRAKFAGCCTVGETRQFCHTRRIVHMNLLLGDGRKHRDLVAFLEATETLRHGGCFGSDHDHWGICPARGGDTSYAVGDARPVLPDAAACIAARPV